MSRRLTTQVAGLSAELLFAAIVMLATRGVIKAGLQMVDDEGRDVEIHLGGRFRAAFAIQVKASLKRLQRHRRQRRLFRTFTLRREDIIDDPRYWYVFAHIDMKQLRFSDYVFLVPSRVVHARVHRNPQGQPTFRFQASMDPAAHDLWTPYRLNALELGPRLVELMRRAPQELRATGALAQLAKRRGLCLLGA